MMVPHPIALGGVLAILAILAMPAAAHFQEIIPSTDTVTEETGPLVAIDLVFTHPMERGPVMNMARPTRVGVVTNGQVIDLGDRAQARGPDGQRSWHLDHAVTGPGNYVFFVEPAPYWEPGEGKFIVHYAKVVVDAYGAGDGWDEMLGLPVEIRPLVRPYGLWVGNVFRGIVERDGTPVPFAEVEVEWRNDGSLVPPADAFITQVIKTDAAGNFAYAMPRAGWWGFAALVEDAETRAGPEGTPAAVELGALMWVRAVDMK